MYKKNIKKERKEGSSASQIVTSYLNSGQIVYSSFRNLPCEINPRIKFEIVKLSIENTPEAVSEKLQIPLSIIKEWKNECKGGLEELRWKHKQRTNKLTRREKVEILAEVANMGIKRIAIKYGLGRTCIKGWEDRVRVTGVNSFLEKKQGNFNKNKIYSVEEKQHILKEVGILGKQQVAYKYDIGVKTIEVWIGKYNFFGEEGLKSLNDIGKRVKMEFPQESKLEAVQYHAEHGLSETVNRYGITNGCLGTWKRQIENMGVEVFLKGKECWEKPHKSSSAQRIQDKGINLLHECGLFGKDLLPNARVDAPDISDVAQRRHAIPPLPSITQGGLKYDKYGAPVEANSLEIAPTPQVLPRADQVDTEEEHDNLIFNNSNSSLETKPETLFIDTSSHILNTGDNILNNYLGDVNIKLSGEEKDEEEIPPSSSINICLPVKERLRQLPLDPYDPDGIKSTELLGKRPTLDQGDLEGLNLEAKGKKNKYLQTVQLMLKHAKEVFPPPIFKKFKLEIEAVANKYISLSFNLYQNLVNLPP